MEDGPQQQQPPAPERVYYEDEISITDIVMRLWRRRGWVILGPALAVLLALTWSLFSVSGINAPVIYYVELRGITGQGPDIQQPEDEITRDRYYPNGAAFSPQDLLLPEVLQAVREELGLEMPMDELREALSVEFGSPMASAITAKYQQRLENQDLSPAQIDQLNEDFAEELRATTQRGLRIEVDFIALGLTEPAGGQIAQAVPEAWSDIFTERFKIFVPLTLPSAAPMAATIDDLGDINEILVAEATLREIKRGLGLIEEDNRLVSLTTTAGNSVTDVRRAVETYESIQFFPIFRQVFADPDLVTRTYIREIELEIRELDAQIEDMNSAIGDVQRFIADASSPAGTDGTSADVLQIDESALQQIVTLATRGDLSQYLSRTIDDRRELAVERAGLMTRLGRTQADSQVASSTEIDALRTRARAGLEELVDQYQQLRDGARSKLRLDQGQLFTPLGEPNVRTSLLLPRLLRTLVAAFVAGLLISVTIVLVLPEENADKLAM